MSHWPLYIKVVFVLHAVLNDTKHICFILWIQYKPLPDLKVQGNIYQYTGNNNLHISKPTTTQWIDLQSNCFPFIKSTTRILLLSVLLCKQGKLIMVLIQILVKRNTSAPYWYYIYMPLSMNHILATVYTPLKHTCLLLPVTFITQIINKSK